MVEQYEKLAEHILKHVGGRENIKNLLHCSARLRFELKDETLADADVLDDTNGIVMTLKSHGQFQLVIGKQVVKLYEAVCEKAQIRMKPQIEEPVEGITEAEARIATNKVIFSPMRGKVIPLNQVEDEAFSTGILGEGIAIEPEEGRVYAPFDGIITVFYRTLHAIGLTSEHGVELLIHVGRDTVCMNGAGFTSCARQGESVKKGDLLLEFDLEGLTAEGCSTVTPVIVTNTYDYSKIIVDTGKTVQPGDTIMMIL